MRQMWMAMGLVIFVLVLGGCQTAPGGAQDDLKAKVAQLENEVKDLKAQVANRPSGDGLRIAYIQAETVFQGYKRTTQAVEKFRAEAEKKQQDLKVLQEKFKKGLLSEDEFQREGARLQQELQRMDLELTTQIQGEMVKVIEQLAKEKGYDWVTQRKDVILYAKPGVLEDITYDVLKILNKE